MFPLCVCYYLGLDQYLAIAFALRYEYLVTTARTWVLIILSWLISALVGVLSAFSYTSSSTLNIWTCNLSTLLATYIQSHNDTLKNVSSTTSHNIYTTSNIIHRNDLNQTMSDNNPLFTEYQNTAFALGVFTLVFVIPSILIAIFYLRIYFEAHNNCKVTET